MSGKNIVEVANENILKRMLNKIKTLDTVDYDGKTFVDAMEIAKIFGFTRPADIIANNCSFVLKNGNIYTSGLINISKGDRVFISEANVYRLGILSPILGKEFIDWIAEEVLPNIRTKGSYNLTIGPTIYSKDLTILRNNDGFLCGLNVYNIPEYGNVVTMNSLAAALGYTMKLPSGSERPCTTSIVAMLRTRSYIDPDFAPKFIELKPDSDKPGTQRYRVLTLIEHNFVVAHSRKTSKYKSNHDKKIVGVIADDVKKQVPMIANNNVLLEARN